MGESLAFLCACMKSKCQQVEEPGIIGFNAAMVPASRGTAVCTVCMCGCVSVCVTTSEHQAKVAGEREKRFLVLGRR